MISHKSMFQKKDSCLYNSNIACLLNFECSSCPIGCNLDFKQAVSVDIEDIFHKSHVKSNNNKITNKKRKKSKINNKLKSEFLFLNNDLSLINDEININPIKTDLKLVNNKFKLFEQEDSKLNETNILIECSTNNLMTTNNLDQITEFKIFNNYSLNKDRKLMLLSNGRLLILKLNNLVCDLHYYLLIILGNSFMKLFINKLICIS